jgi:hypothetical protein
MERREALTPDKKDKTFRLYINQSNIKVWEAIAYAESQGISPSDYLCKKVIEEFQRNKDLPIVKIQEDQPKNLIDELVSLAVDYEHNGIDGLDISYCLPRYFDQGLISREDMALLGVFLIKSYITFMETGNVRKVLTEIDPLSSKRDITSVSIMEQFKEHLIEKIQYDPEKIKREEEIRLRLQEEEHIHKMKQIRLEKIRQEKQDWELLHFDIPFDQRDMTEEQREIRNKLDSGDYVIIGSDEELQEQELNQHVYINPIQVQEEETQYESIYYPALEKFLNITGLHIN